MISIGQRLDQHRGIGPGFDFLRVALAVLVVFWHSFIIVPGQTAPDYRPFVWLPHYMTLSLFFALSGFLISGSALRLSLSNFLINRGLRIFPALAVEIVLSAFVLGPLFTMLPAQAYFGSPTTYHYLTNIVALINYHLPGVFESNPSPLVNASLWTVPGEFLCYFIMSCFMIVGVLRRPALTAPVGLIIGLTGWLLLRSGYGDHPAGLARIVFAHFEIGPTARVTIAFVAGVVAYQLRYRLPHSWAICGACAALLALLACLPPGALSLPMLGLITAAPIAYLTAFIGTCELPTLPLFHRGDYSYGVYLYGFPVQQAVFSLTRTITSPWLQFAMALPVIVGFAIFSWHCIEKPVLAMRKRFSFVARVRGVDVRQSAVAAPPAEAAEAR